MKTTAIFSILLVLSISSGCKTVINAFEREDFYNTRPGDTIMRGTNTVYEITQDGRWLSEDTIGRAMEARVKR